MLLGLRQYLRQTDNVVKILSGRVDGNQGFRREYWNEASENPKGSHIEDPIRLQFAEDSPAVLGRGLVRCRIQDQQDVV